MGSSRPRDSIRARKARSAKSLPRSRRKLAPRKPSKLRTTADVLLLDDSPDLVGECLSDAWSVLDCAVTCLDVLAQNSDVRPSCQPADVGVLVRLAVELIRRAQEVADLGGAA